MSAPPTVGDQTLGAISARISGIALTRPFGRVWRWGIGIALALTLLLACGIAALLYKGVGIWGLNMPVAWAFAICNYVWWIGIGMGGTFISGALYLAGKDWRNSINRYAEAMTVFAVSVSGIFPILHLGRPWFFYWLFPYPDIMNVWPQWRSSLEWDFYAILAYLSVSILYWYVGMIPDLATLRDRAQTLRRARIYGFLALGWQGEARQWRRFQTLSLLLAGLAVPLVFSVHSMVALDFSEGVLPGWHSSIFPPFFVAGALFSGFAMVLVLGIPMRRVLGLQAYITGRHLDNLAKVMLAVGLVVDYSYLTEIFMAFYSMDRYEIAVTLHRMQGAYAWLFWGTIVCNVLAIQFLWSARCRRNPAALFVIGLIGAHRHVAGALHAHRHQLVPRLPTVELGHVLSDVLGHRVSGRIDRTIFAFVPAVRARAAGGVHVRAAQTGAHADSSALMKPVHGAGLIAEFSSAAQLLDAARRARAAGLGATIQAYSPYPVDGLDGVLDAGEGHVALCTLLGGLGGGLATFALECYSAVYDYPINVGGRPLLSWPAFLPPALEMTLAGAAACGIAAMLIECRLPRFYHPLFDVKGFERASSDRFFLLLSAPAQSFDARGVRSFLESLSPLSVAETEA